MDLLVQQTVGGLSMLHLLAVSPLQLWNLGHFNFTPRCLSLYNCQMGTTIG